MLLLFETAGSGQIAGELIIKDFQDDMRYGMRTGVVDAVDKALKLEEFGHRPGAPGGDLQVLWQQGAAEFDATGVALVVYDHPLP